MLLHRKFGNNSEQRSCNIISWKYGLIFMICCQLFDIPRERFTSIFTTTQSLEATLKKPSSSQENEIWKEMMLECFWSTENVFHIYTWFLKEGDWWKRCRIKHLQCCRDYEQCTNQCYYRCRANEESSLARSIHWSARPQQTEYIVSQLEAI